MELKIAVLPGDGIGPEVTEEAVRTLHAVEKRFGHDFALSECAIGGAAINKFGTPLPDQTLAACLKSDAVFLGAVGLPEHDHLPASQRAEAGLLSLRKGLGAFANLRPSICFDGLEGCSPLKSEIISGADILIVRELLGGLYFGSPRGFDHASDNAHSVTSGFNTMRYSVAEVERIAHIAFQAARKRRRKVTSVDKANVLETSQLWRKVVTRVGQEYSDVTLEHFYVDACAMHLVTNPKHFDVIVTENLFGDILSDEAAVLTGSLGMLGSASIGGMVDLYEPVHGSAPDIAGKGIANPCGAILSIALLLKFTAQLEPEAEAVESAIRQIISDGHRTVDIVRSETENALSTKEIGKLVEQAIHNWRQSK